MIFLKVVLLFIYILLILAAYRLVDYIAWSDAASVATLVDPIQLSLRQLRWLLHARGVNYHGAIEKKDLSDLVSASGAVRNDEVTASEELNSYNTYETKTFTDEKDFEYSVEKSEDIWLVQIVAENKKPIITSAEWKKLTKRLHSVGIHTGLMFCENNAAECCRRRSFTSSQLLISYRFKEYHKGIHRKHYWTRHADESSAFNWISHVLQDLILPVNDVTLLENNWLNPKSRNRFPVQVLYISPLAKVPATFAALNIKFKGEVRFGCLQWSGVGPTSQLQQILNVNKTLPKAFICVITDHQIYIYGDGLVRGEFAHFDNLNMLLQHLKPDVNLVFTWSIYLCNVLAVLSFLTTNNILTRTVSVVKSFIAYNAFVLGAWLFLSSYRPYFTRVITEWMLTRIQISATVEWAASLRYDMLQLRRFPFLVVIGLVFFFQFVLILLRKLKLVSDEPVPETDLSDILLSNDNRSLGYNDISRRWIERLATPGFWLQPLVPSDYIENLPVWKYTGDSLQSSDEADVDQSMTARTSSPSPPRSRAAHLHVSRGRPCSIEQRTSFGPSGRRGLIWSIRNCLRGRSPRIRKISAPPEGMREEQSCSVCLDYYKVNVDVCGLPCGHVFHHTCILAWLHGDHHCCPICRWPAYQTKFRNC